MPKYTINAVLALLEELGEACNDTDSFSNAATITEVQKKDFKLTHCIYGSTQAQEDDKILFEDKIVVLKEQLMSQYEKGEIWKKQIVDNFRIKQYIINNPANWYDNTFHEKI